MLNAILNRLSTKHARYIRLGAAIDPLMNTAALDELVRVAEYGDITWSDWMRIGRRAGLKPAPKN
jgi:hypothetical protein